MRPREQFPWFWNNAKFTGERVNDVHLTAAEKRAAGEASRGNQTPVTRHWAPKTSNLIGRSRT